MRRKMREGPSAAEGTPLFGARRNAPILELFDHPIRSREIAWRIGHAGSVGVGEVEHRVHHLGVLESLSFDLVDRPKIDALFGARWNQNHFSECPHREN